MEFSDNAKYWLRKLGNFGVTSSGNEIKGWALLDGDDDYERVYFSAEDLRKLANAANEVADKLDGGLTKRPPDADEQNCPACDGSGELCNQWGQAVPCDECKGTGSSNRSPAGNANR